MSGRAYVGTKQEGYFLFLHRGNHLLEHFRLVLCEVCENLAVDLDAFFLERRDECAVVHPFGADGGVDLDGPELAEGALLFFTSAECAGEGMEQSLLCGALF